MNARREPARLAGEAFAVDHDANGCVAEGMLRLSQRDGMFDVSEHTFFVTACLEKAERPADFCEGVPAPSDVFAGSDWTAKKCYRLGYRGDTRKCAGVVGAIKKACHPKR